MSFTQLQYLPLNFKVWSQSHIAPTLIWRIKKKSQLIQTSVEICEKKTIDYYVVYYIYCYILLDREYILEQKVNSAEHE